MTDGSGDEWRFDHHEVLEDEHGRWWHVVNRYRCGDTGHRMYRLYDATHTGDDYLNAERVESDEEWADTFESAGWSTATKPAHEHGYRVNGVLCEPATVENYLGNACVSDWDCPDCGEATTDEADVIIDLVNRERSNVKITCGACGHTNQVSFND